MYCLQWDKAGAKNEANLKIAFISPEHPSPQNLIRKASIDYFSSADFQAHFSFFFIIIYF